MFTARRHERSLVILNERIRACPLGTTELRAKIAPALRVVAKKAPLGVAPRSFGTTKPRLSRLNWRFFSHNSGNPISVNRP